MPRKPPRSNWLYPSSAENSQKITLFENDRSPIYFDRVAALVASKYSDPVLIVDFKMLNVIPHDMRQISRSAISPAAPFFHYGHALALRNMVLASGDAELPLYLLAPEIAVLLAYFPDLRQRLYIDTLWKGSVWISKIIVR